MSSHTKTTEDEIPVFCHVDVVQLELHTVDKRRKIATSSYTGWLLAGLILLSSSSSVIWVDCLQIGLLLLREKQVVDIERPAGVTHRHLDLHVGGV